MAPQIDAHGWPLLAVGNRIHPTGFSYLVASGDNRCLWHEDSCGRDGWTSIILPALKGLTSFPQPWETNGG